MSADPEKAMEVVDDNDHESLDEDDEDGDKMEVSFQIFRISPFSLYQIAYNKLSCPIHSIWFIRAIVKMELVWL